MGTRKTHAEKEGPDRRITLSAALLLGSCLAIIGCAAPKAPPAVGEGRFAGPGVALLASDVTRYEVVVEAPNPGWSSRLDQVRDGPGRSEIYVSLREPSPLLIYPQVVTTQRLGLPRGVRIPAMVLARVLPHAYEEDEDGPAYKVAVPESTPGN